MYDLDKHIIHNHFKKSTILVFSNKIAINIIKQATKKLISGPEADIL